MRTTTLLLVAASANALSAAAFSGPTLRSPSSSALAARALADGEADLYDFFDERDLDAELEGDEFDFERRGVAGLLAKAATNGVKATAGAAKAVNKPAARKSFTASKPAARKAAAGASRGAQRKTRSSTQARTAGRTNARTNGRAPASRVGGMRVNRKAPGATGRGAASRSRAPTHRAGCKRDPTGGSCAMQSGGHAPAANGAHTNPAHHDVESQAPHAQRPSRWQQAAALPGQAGRMAWNQAGRGARTVGNAASTAAKWTHKNLVPSAFKDLSHPDNGGYRLPQTIHDPSHVVTAEEKNRHELLQKETENMNNAKNGQVQRITQCGALLITSCAAVAAYNRFFKRAGMDIDLLNWEHPDARSLYDEDDETLLTARDVVKTYYTPDR